MWDKVDFKAKTITGAKERHLIIKRAAHQENVTVAAGGCQQESTCLSWKDLGFNPQYWKKKRTIVVMMHLLTQWNI